MIHLEIEGLCKNYGSFHALQDVSFSVPKASVYGILGPNGAGKTTLIRIVNQILGADAGTVRLGGELLNRKHILDIGYLPEERGLYRKMKVGDQAIFFARLKGMSRSDAIRELKKWFEKFEIMPWWNKKVQELSKGMAQKVQFIVTVLHKPSLLIFDEPFSGFDPINANLLKDEILHLRDEGATILFSTHNMPSVEEVCDHITLINASRNVLTGEINEVRDRFSRPVYSVAIREPKDPQEIVLPDSYEVKRKEPALPGLWEATVHLQDASASSNHLLSQLMAIGEIVEFTREKATMQDIFIRAVKESAPESNTESTEA